MDQTTLIIIVAVIGGFFLIVFTIVIVVVCRRRRGRQAHESHENLGFSDGSQTGVNENISGKMVNPDIKDTERDASITSKINNSLDVNGDSRFSGNSKDKTLNYIQIQTSQDKTVNNRSPSSQHHTVIPSIAGSAELIYASTDVTYTTIANNKFTQINKSSQNRDHATDNERHYSALHHKVKTFENPYNVIPMNSSNSRSADVGDTEVGELEDTSCEVSPYAVIDVVRESASRRNTNLQDRSRTQNVTSRKETKTGENSEEVRGHYLNHNTSHAVDVSQTEFSHRRVDGVVDGFPTDKPKDALDGLQDDSHNIYYELEPKEESDSDDPEETCV